MQTILDYLRAPLVELQGTSVTALSILTAILILIVARVISRALAKRLHSSFSHHPGVGFTVSKITRWAGMLIGILIALTTVGLNMSAVMAAMAVLLVGIGFGLQKMAENFISGLILLVERPIRVGDFVQVDTFKGTVRDIGLRTTRIESEEGRMHLIPNGELITKTVTNYTESQTPVEVSVQVGVAYGLDLQHVRSVLLEVAAAYPKLRAQPAPEVRFEKFGDSSCDLALEGWIDHAREEDDIKSDLRFAIAARFRALEIEIPFPQREVRVRASTGTTVS